jgi:adenylosuccinate lyase
MPHKRNPIKSEQISGLARVLRGNAQAGLENVALWHERDISHSSVERVILPDSTILIDHMQHSATTLVQGLVVDEARMLANLESTHGALYSQRVLLALVSGDPTLTGTPSAARPKGHTLAGAGGQAGERSHAPMSRDDAYRIAQELAQRAWDEETSLRDLLAADERTAGLDLDAIFDPAHFTRYAREIVGRLEEIA